MCALAHPARDTRFLVSCKNHQRFEMESEPSKITRYGVVFEVYNPHLILQMSELLTDFKLTVGNEVCYQGRATISNLVSTATCTVCEVTLAEPGIDVAAVGRARTGGSRRADFDQVIADWQNMYKIVPEYKVVIADLQTLLTDLRQWSDRLELEIQASPNQDRARVEAEVLHEIAPPVMAAIDALHERLEEISDRVDPEWRPAYHAFTSRQLHPLMLCSPFGYRTYEKPLGFAGDYKIVEMIFGDPYEGPSLFAKLINFWFLSQYPARAHRNRIQYLRDRLIEEASRVAAAGRPLRVLNLGCGPAIEIQQFIAESPLSDRAKVTLQDFDEETILYTGKVLDDLKKQFRRQIDVKIEKKSVHFVLKEAARMRAGTEEDYDFVYCAGLFDYLPDSVCNQLMRLFHAKLAAGGLLTITNVDACKPFRNMLEFVLDWRLIYRNQKQGALLVPHDVPPENRSVKKDPTEVNLFVEVRKPEHA